LQGDPDSDDTSHHSARQCTLRNDTDRRKIRIDSSEDKDKGKDIEIEAASSEVSDLMRKKN
jgi:hypothetical protein